MAALWAGVTDVCDAVEEFPDALGAEVEVVEGAEDAVPVGAGGAVELRALAGPALEIAVVPGAVVPIPFAAGRESALRCAGDPMARLVMSPVT